jgi:cell division protein FtsZ
MNYDNTLEFSEQGKPSSFIKVIGVGGGGGNAVNHMYGEGIDDVNFAIFNTDYQDLIKSKIPVKLQLGKELTNGLGAGGNPEKGRMAAEESKEDIKDILKADNTKMVFVTAGMGGGTGTGAAPIVAGIAKEMGILTVGIVTIPFEFEMHKKRINALKGVEEMSKNVDALLVINNQQLVNIYPDLDMGNAFAKADEILNDSAKGIADIITQTGYINVDFADVCAIMKDSGVAIMNTGYANDNSETRVLDAIKDALSSPLLKDSNIRGAQRILLNIHTSKDNKLTMKETEHLRRFLYSIGHDIEFIWGAIYDDNLEESLKITIIATGFKIDEIPSIGKIESSTTPMDDIFPKEIIPTATPKEEVKAEPTPAPEPVEEPKEPEEEVIDWDSWISDEDDDDEIPPSQRKK